MKNSGVALFGLGESEKDETVESLVEKTITNPLLERDIKGANKILINITSGPTLSMNGVQTIINTISERASGTIDGVELLIYGHIYEEDRENVVLSVVATGFDQTEGLSNDLYDGKIFEEKKEEGSEFNLVPQF